METFRPSFARWLMALLLSLHGAVRAGAAPPQISSTNNSWARIVMVGASASAGFTLSEPFGGTNTLKCRLSNYLEAALVTPHEPVKNLANALFFLLPEPAGRMQIEQALKAKPTLLIGLDFLFWFCYGQGTNNAERAQRFEEGLTILESVKCPLVLGDIPDASSATNTGIISPAQVPSAPAVAAANHRLRQWAATHPLAVIVPLAGFMRVAMANQALTVHGETLPAGKTRGLLQSDQLHPSPRGAAMLALGVLDALTSRNPRFPAGDVRWNFAEVLRRGGQSALAIP